MFLLKRYFHRPQSTAGWMSCFFCLNAKRVQGANQTIEQHYLAVNKDSIGKNYESKCPCEHEISDSHSKVFQLGLLFDRPFIMTKFKVSLAALCVLAVVTDTCGAFQPHGVTRRMPSSATSTELAVVGKIMGRFRRKKTVDAKKLIQVGSPLPTVDVEIVTATNDDGIVESTPTEIAELLGTGTNLLVGMPGAYTTTCTKKHMPGYVSAAPKLKRLGVDKIAIVTTNDRFVNSAWAKDLGILNGVSSGDDGKEQAITILSDGDGDLVRELGLADDM